MILVSSTEYCLLNIRVDIGVLTFKRSLLQTIRLQVFSNLNYSLNILFLGNRSISAVSRCRTGFLAVPGEDRRRSSVSGGGGSDGNPTRAWLPMFDRLVTK